MQERLSYRVFGKNGVMGDLEPIKETKSHELMVVVEGVAKMRQGALVAPQPMTEADLNTVVAK